MTIKTDNYQIGLSSDPLKNFTLRTPATPDGSMIISRGNADNPGATILTINPQGAIVLPDGTYVGGNGYRNRIINGNFDFWQRGSALSYTGVGSANANANGYGFGPDRWAVQAYSGTNTTGTTAIQASQQAFALGQTVVPGEPQFFMRVQATALAPVGGTSAAIRARQPIESVRTLAGKQAMVSFWAKADSARTYAVFLAQNFGTGGSPSSTVAVGATINVTSSWQYFSVPLSVPSIAGKTIGANKDDSLSLEFILYKQDNTVFNDTLGQIGTFTTAAYLDLARVQAEEGTVASKFEDRDYGDELRRCQRYYEPFTFTIGRAYNATQIDWGLKYSVTKRAVPSYSVIKPAHTVAVAGGATQTSSGSTVFSGVSSVTGGFVNLTGYAGLTAGTIMVPYDSGDVCAASAEL